MPMGVTNRRQDYSSDIIIQRYGPVIHGFGPPADFFGHAGNIYIDDQALQMYFKRQGYSVGAWYNYVFTVPSNVSSQIAWYGVENPSNDLGSDGDYFLQFPSRNFAYYPSLVGPKVRGIWPTSAEGSPISFSWLTVNFLEGVGSEVASTLGINTTPITFVGLGSEAVGPNLNTSSMIPIGLLTAGGAIVNWPLNLQGV
jgi:hypothetical protein